MHESADENRLRDWCETNCLAALRTFGISDKHSETVFDNIVRVAAEVCHAPIAALNLIDEHRQWSKAFAGSSVCATTLNAAICAHAMRQSDLFFVRDALGTRENKHAGEALLRSEERLRFALQTTGFGIWDADLVAGNREWTQEARDILGLVPETPTTRETFLNRLHPDDRSRIDAKFFATVPESILVYEDECRVFRADTGEERWVAVSGRTILDNDGRAIRKLGTIQDITDRKKAEDALRDSEARLQLALQAARMVAWEQDTRTNYITFSENSLALLGVKSGHLGGFLERLPVEDQVRWAEFIAKIHAAAADTMEFRYALPDGQLLWLASRAQQAGPNRVVGVTFDITDRKAAEEEIWRAATHDALTGLPNRLFLQHQLDQTLEEARQKGTSVNLLVIDLDNFKDVNDSLGHATGGQRKICS